ncbi:hypothetical protein GCM10027046_33540 [Uliginosibacterium flavum]|uniref:DUF2325 domain-containing protein n=1 Tax=Uliginosibacterium flavum TaxID=1396831 RepID=A0ABV2TPA5_9RHOO
MFPTTLIKQVFVPQAETLRVGSRRQRLWELATHVHCPVIGVCLPLGVLRRISDKATPELAGADDYALHSAAVQLARKRNVLSEALQDELELRHGVVVQVFRKARERGALLERWQEAVSAGELAGALWAVLTHPLCDAELAEAISQQLHMIQHQAGAALRLDITRYHTLQDENGVLARSLATAQQRCERITQEKTVELERLQGELMRLRAAFIGKETELAALRAERASLQPVATDQAARRRLEQQLVYQEERGARLSLENVRLSKALAAQQIEPPTVTEMVPILLREVDTDASLDGHRILCVGGRESAVVIYRKLVEQAGGKFLHHDGGIEDRFGQLDSALGAADLVICQTGCISHNAYWRVKDHCKRTGKRCAFVQTPSAAGLARGLQRLLSNALVESENDVQTAATGGVLIAGLQQT